MRVRAHEAPLEGRGRELTGHGQADARDIEDEFGVSIAPTEVERSEMNTVNLIVYQVEKRL